MAIEVAAWPSVALGEVMKQNTAYVSELEPRLYPKLSVKWWGKGAVLDTPADGAMVRMSRHQLARPGQVIVSEIWAKHGSIGIVPAEGAGALITSHFFLFDMSVDRILPQYMDYLIQANYLTPLMAEIAQGTTSYAAIRPQQFLSVRIPLPPLDEQRRIVARIEALVARIAEARGLRREAVAEREALLLKAMEACFNCYPTSGALGDVLASAPRNGWSPRCDNADDGVPVLSLGAVTGYRYRSSEFKTTSEPTNSQGHYWLKPGDLLITRSNTPELVGHAAIYDGQPTPCIYPDLMMRLEVNSELADSRFVHWWLQGAAAREYIGVNAKGTSPSMKKISQTVVAKIPFPTDARLDEQQRIVAYLDTVQAQVDVLKRLQAETAAELEALLPSVLDKAFRGEL